MTNALATAWRRLDDSFMVSAKLIFFTMGMVIYGFYVFRGPFIDEYLGINMRYYGMISAMMAAISFPCTTLWNTFADYLGRHKGILVFITLSSVACLECLMFRVGGRGSTAGLVYAVSVLALYAFFTSGMVPLLDYEALKLLGSRPQFSKEMYGRQRLWGTLAYACSTMVAAFLMDRGGQQVLFFIMPVFGAVFATVLVLAGPKDEPKTLGQVRARLRGELSSESVEQDADAALEKQPAAKDADTGHAPAAKDADTSHPPAANDILLHSQTPLTKDRRSAWRILMTNPTFLFFLFAVFMNGMARAVMTTFLAMFWKKVYMLSMKQIAVATIFGIAIEVIIFFFGPWFAPLGNYWMLLLAQAAMALRCWAYWALPAEQGRYWQVWVVELLKGVAFGFTHTAGVKLAAESAPPGLEATAQALYTSMYAQLPAIIAAIIGGNLYQDFGPRMLFFVTAIVSTVALALFTVKYAWEGRLLVSRRARQ